MKQLMVLWAICLLVPRASAGEVILESGINTSGNFNGWYVPSFS